MAAAGTSMMPKTPEELGDLIRGIAQELWDQRAEGAGGASAPPWIAPVIQGSQAAAESSQQAVEEASRLKMQVDSAASDIQAQSDLISRIVREAEEAALQQQASAAERQDLEQRTQEAINQKIERMAMMSEAGMNHFRVTLLNDFKTHREEIDARIAEAKERLIGSGTPKPQTTTPQQKQQGTSSVGMADTITEETFRIHTPHAEAIDGGEP